jgi:hypothetical protein
MTWKSSLRPQTCAVLRCPHVVGGTKGSAINDLTPSALCEAAIEQSSNTVCLNGRPDKMHREDK